MYQIFISSTSKDLEDYRSAVFEAINKLSGFHAVRMEDFGARAAPADEFCPAKVADCKVAVLILGLCYGSVPEGGDVSYTEQEYETAMTANIPCLAFLSKDGFYYSGYYREPDELCEKQQKFRNRINGELIRAEFSTPENLAQKVTAALSNWALEQGKDVFSCFDKRMKVFKPLRSVLKVGKLGQLFDNQLVYFTPAEDNDKARLCDTLQQEHMALLQGQPAKGKTVTAYAVARSMEKAGWQVYYHSFKPDVPSCWPDIESHLYHKYLFILDDCHLNIEALTDIYYRIHDHNRTAALLCISRPLADSLQESPNYDFNVFEALREVTFAQQECDTAKIAGITSARRNFYQQNGGEYRSGDAAILARKVYGNLVTLSFYLEQWQHTRDLEQVNDAQVLTGIYAQYFKPLDERSIECLVRYACLFCFEIEFEVLPGYEHETEQLAKKGIIEHQREHIYIFYHSEFAHLLVRAYAAHEGSRITRQYNSLDNFILAQIKAYLLAFKEKYRYPAITHSLFLAMAKARNNGFLERLLTDRAIIAVLLEYYRDEKSENNIAQFILLLSRFFPKIFNSFFEILVSDNAHFHQVSFETSRALTVYIVTLINLKQSPEAYQRFLSKWGYKKHSVFEKSSLPTYARALLSWQRTINRREAKELFIKTDEQILLVKLEQATFSGIGNALNELNQVNADKAAALFVGADSEMLLKKLEQVTFSGIGNALNQLNQVNAAKAAALFADADNEMLLKKLEQVEFTNIGCALNELNQVNAAKAAALFADADNEMLLKKLEQVEFTHIGKALNELNQVNPDKAAALFADADNEMLLKKLEQVEFTNIGCALNELNQVNAAKAAALFADADNEMLLKKLEQVEFTHIGKALNELNQVNPDKAAALFADADNEMLLKKLEQVEFTNIGCALNELNQVNAAKAAALFADADNEMLLKKLEQVEFTNIGNALNELKQVNTDKAAALFAAADNEMLLKKLEQVEFTNIGKALNELNQVNAAKAAVLFADADNEMLLKKLKQGDFINIGQALNELNKVNADKAAALFAAADNEMLLEKLQQANFVDIGEALSNLKQVNKIRTIELYALAEDVNVLAEKAQQGRLEFIQIVHSFSQLYSVHPGITRTVFQSIQNLLPVDTWIQEILRMRFQRFIHKFVVLANLDSTFAKSILQRLPESYLQEWKVLKKTETYNCFLYSLWLCGFSTKDALVQSLLEFAQVNLNTLLSDKSSRNIGSFLYLLNTYQLAKCILQNDYKRLMGKMLWEQDKYHLPKYIAIIHEIDETTGLEFLKTLQRREPKLIEQFGFTHLYIGQNYQKQGDSIKAEEHFAQAEKLLLIIGHTEGLALLEKIRLGEYADPQND